MAVQDPNQRRLTTAAHVSEDAIVELVYEPALQRTGLAVYKHDKVTIEQEFALKNGHVLVPYPPDNNLLANGCVLLPSKPEPHGGRSNLVADIKGFLHRYVGLTEDFEEIAAHYVLLSWLHDAFTELPYLRLRGDYGTGKTRGLIAIGSICYRPIFASGASTVSPIFHMLDRFGGTLILDEADLRFSDAASDLVKILNNGHMRGLPVLRSVPNHFKEYAPRAFRVFGPKIVAMRGEFSDLALESRFITEETSFTPMRPDLPTFIPPSLHLEAQVLRNRLLDYRFSNLRQTTLDPGAALDGGDFRTSQIAKPLLSLIDAPVLRRRIGDRLVRQYEEGVRLRQSSTEVQVLEILHQACEQRGGLPISVGEITARLNAKTEREQERPVATKLVGHLIRKGLRLGTVRSRGVYVVAESERAKIELLSARYNGNGALQSGASSLVAVTQKSPL